MAYCDAEFPHNETDFKMKVTPDDFGPLNVIGEHHIGNFRGGTYYVTTPKSSFITLYRLWGGNAGLDGQYWTVERRTGNEGYRHDMAVERNWGNSLQQDSSIIVPAGTLMYEGYAAAQRQYLGGGWQVFIPKDVLQPILEINKIAKSGPLNPSAIERIIKPEVQKIDQSQSVIVKKWNDERIKRLEASTDLLISNWRQSGNMPSDLRRIMDGNKSEIAVQKVEDTGNKTYSVSRKQIKLLDGTTRNLTLTVRKEFVRSETRTYQTGRTIVHETTNYYNLIKEWK